MSLWELPTSLVIGEVEYPIRSDFRAIIDILCLYEDPDLDAEEKAMCCLDILYFGIENIPAEFYAEALEKAVKFIDAGMEGKSSGPRLMDWEQDAPIIIPAVNKVLGKECRAEKYMHWYTFLGAYMEIGESLYAEVLNIRQKRVKGKKLEDYEQQFASENSKMIALKQRYTKEELEYMKRLNAELKESR